MSIYSVERNNNQSGVLMLQASCVVECYKHKWIIDFIGQQIDLLSYQITNTDRLERRLLKYVGKYLLQDEENYKRKNYIRKLVMKKIEESSSHYGGFSKEQIRGSLDDEKSAILYDCYSNQIEKRSDIGFWIDTLAGDNPKYRTILLAVSQGYTFTETAEILTLKFGGKVNGNRTLIKRFREDCRKRKNYLLDSFCV